MGFNLIYWTPMSGLYLLYGFILEKCGNSLKNSCFPGGYGRIGEISHGRIWPDWGL